MKRKKVTYTSTVWNPNTRAWDSYQVPTLDEKIDLSAFSDGIKTISAFSATAVLVLHLMGVV